ncbi:MAG: RodZ domain-containing protein [Candidatus Flexifilum sp.]
MDAQALGRYLRQAREARELTLEDAEATLKIRARVLEMFELGEFNLPNFNAVQLRGFLRNYANYLGLEEDRVMQYYDAVLLGPTKQRGSLIGGARRKNGRKKSKRDTATLPAVQPVSVRQPPRSTPRPTDTPPGLPAVRIDPREAARAAAAREPASTFTAGRDSAPSGGVLVVITRLLVAGAALAVIVFVLTQLIELPARPQADPFTAGVLGELPATLTATPPAPTFTARPATQVAVIPLNSFSGDGLQVILTFDQRTWIALSVDGQPVYTDIARPGDRLEYVAANEIRLTASNAGALEVVFNGQPQPAFGMRGQRVDVTFTLGGITVQTGPGFEPTPVVSNTPLPTPTDPAGALLAGLTPISPPTLAESLPTPLPPADLPPTPDFVPITATFTPELPEGGADVSAVSTPTPLPGVPPAGTGDLISDFAATATFLAAQPPAAQPTDVLPPPQTATWTPSPTLTPSPTVTPSPTLTPSPTVTPSPTATPTPSGLLPPRQPLLTPTPTKSAP